MPRFSLGSLRFRAVSLVLLCLFPLLGLLIFSYVQERNRAIAEVKLDAVALARNLAQLQANLVDDSHQLLATLAQIPQVQNRDVAGCEAIFAKLQKTNDRYSTFLAATPDGNVFASVPPVESPLNVKDRQYFHSAVETGKFTVGRAYLDRLGKKTNLTFSYPVLDQSGKLSAVLIAGLDLNWLGKILQRMDLPAQSSIILADPKGTILYRYPNPEQFLGKSMPEAPVVKAMITQGQGVMEAPGLDGKLVRFFGFASMESRFQEPFLALGIPKPDVLNRVNQELRRNLFFLGLIALLSLTAAWAGADLFIVSQVKKLVGVTQRLSAGDLKVRTGKTYQAGELGMLARSFDQMADSIQERDTRLKEAASELQQRVRELDERTAQLEDANREMESFSYSVSHDLRAPLRGIAGFSRILLEEYGGKLDAGGKRYLDIIQNDTRRMGKLIDDILALSRLGRKDLRRGRFKMENLAQAVFKKLLELEPERKMEFRVSSMPTAWGDRDMLRQVVMNLLANAFKFTREKEDAVIEVSGWTEGQENVYCIRDNGVGFEMEYAGKLFGVFQRLHSEEQFEGTGVGLAIVERIIHRHGGRVWGEGKPGAGAAFWFSLPQEAAGMVEV